MATATATDTPNEVTPEDRPPEDPAAEEPTSAPRATRFRAVLLGVLAVALVVSGATAFHLGSSRHVWPFAGGPADRTQGDREAVMGQTQQFVLRLNTYGPGLLDAQGQMPDYRRRVKEVITPKFAVSFDQSVAVAEQSVKNYGLHRTCAVFATGVELLDSDSAQVLVAGSFSQTARDRKGKEVATGEPAPFRLRVSLDKIDGRWLVDDYQPVTTS